MKDVYLFKGERAWFILAIWFMAIVSLITMCSEGLRGWQDEAATEKMWQALNYKPTNSTYIHFFDNDEGTNNDNFIYTNVNSSGRYSDRIDISRHCYRWRYHHLSSEHTKIINRIEGGRIHFGLERGFAYLFFDRYRPESEACKEINRQYGRRGGQPARTRRTIKVLPFGGKQR